MFILSQYNQQSGEILEALSFDTQQQADVAAEVVDFMLETVELPKAYGIQITEINPYKDAQHRAYVSDIETKNMELIKENRELKLQNKTLEDTLELFKKAFINSGKQLVDIQA